MRGYKIYSLSQNIPCMIPKLVQTWCLTEEWIGSGNRRKVLNVTFLFSKTPPRYLFVMEMVRFTRLQRTFARSEFICSTMSSQLTTPSPGFLVLCMKSCMNGFRITRIAWRISINFLHGKRFLTKLVERMKESVTHPSAAQSVKNQSEEINLTASLDLHVLSTPPAFILSQDQTL